MGDALGGLGGAAAVGLNMASSVMARSRLESAMDFIHPPGSPSGWNGELRQVQRRKDDDVVQRLQKRDYKGVADRERPMRGGDRACQPKDESCQSPYPRYLDGMRNCDSEYHIRETKVNTKTDAPHQDC